MTNNEIRNAVKELKSLEALISDLSANATAIKDSIRTEMKGREIETLDLGDMVIRNTTVLTNRFDTTAFKKLNNDLYTSFLKQVVAHKFSYSA